MGSGRNHEESLNAAQCTYNAARAESVALEKLHDRHAEALLAEDLHAEQNVLDEIAGARWHRNRTEATESAITESAITESAVTGAAIIEGKKS